MSDAKRSRDFWRMRQLAKAMRTLIPRSSSVATIRSAMQRPQYKSLELEFDRLWKRYGMKSDVADLGRNVSTRKANALRKKLEHRASKRHERQLSRLRVIRELSE